MGGGSAQGGDPRETADTILVVEDEADIRALIAMQLEEEGFHVIEVQSVAEAETAIAEHDVTLALIDVRLRDQSGLDLVRRLADTAEIGVIIVSGRAASVDRIVGIELGADDYVTKPFDNRELLARVKRHVARMRTIRAQREARDSRARIEVNGLVVDQGRHAVYGPDGRQMGLSDAEFRTLAELARRRGTVMSRDELYNAVVGAGARDPLDRRIDVYVSSIRKKLGPSAQVIRTIHRVGYTID